VSKTRASWHLKPTQPQPDYLHKQIELRIKLPPPDLLSRLGSLDLTPVGQEKSSNKELRLEPCETQDEARLILQELIERVGSIGKDKTALGDFPKENVIVEFGSPNIAKPLHMGHLRSTVTGHYIARICRAAGHEVTSMCFLGDWGTQFGLLHVGLYRV